MCTHSHIGLKGFTKQNKSLQQTLYTLILSTPISLVYCLFYFYKQSRKLILVLLKTSNFQKGKKNAEVVRLNEKNMIGV